MPTNRPLLCTKAIKINGYDIDVMGIVSNIVYVRWFEDLRFHFLDTYWPFEDMLDSKQSPILAETKVIYKKPLTIFDKPEGKVWVESLGRAKWTVGLEICTETHIHCLGTQTGYFFDMEKNRPVALPQELRDRYEKALQHEESRNY